MRKFLFSILLLWSGILQAQSIPDTAVFSLSDVLAITGGTSLSQAFTNSVDSLFDIRYKGSKNSLSNFRNYHGSTAYSNVIYFQDKKIQNPDTTHYNFVQSKNIAYLSLGVMYDSSGTNLTKPFATYPEMSLYDTLMNNSPYRALWLGGVNIPTSTDTITISKNLVFDADTTVQVGIIGDNYFRVLLNGVQVTPAIYGITIDVNNFKYLHYFPISVTKGNNTFSFVGYGDGYVDQALGFIILQNTKAQVFNSPDSTTWDVLLKSDQFIGSDTTYICSYGYSYNSTTGKCEKITDISYWTSGDDVLLSFAFSQTIINDITSWTLNFGDTNSTSGTTFNPLISHTYAASGSYTVILSAHLSTGGNISATQIITLP